VQAPTRAVTIKAHNANTGNVYVGGNLLLSGCAFHDTEPGLPSPPSYSVAAEGGTVSVTGCQFIKPSHHVSMTNGVTKGIVLGNIFPGVSPVIFNNAQASVVLHNL
jgi:hypothetical protein